MRSSSVTQIGAKRTELACPADLIQHAGSRGQASEAKPTFYEFFAGGGMARAGLGAGWRCVFANDFDLKKGLTYQENWGAEGALKIGDVRTVSTEDLPGIADLAWASFPCQDLSLAGGGAGLKGERSGTFYSFWGLMKALIADGRAPRIIVLENVTGALTSHSGEDFEAICEAFAENGYRYGALVIDASLFVPQSRPRLFAIGVREDIEIPETLTVSGPTAPFHTRGLQTAYEKLKAKTKKDWTWWSLPTPPQRNNVFADVIEENPGSVAWHTDAETKQLLGMMSDINIAKLEQAKRSGRKMVGGVYKRTRTEKGLKVQRAEIRFDDIAGCLRTPAGGSSRQVIVVVEGDRVRSRLVSARETARLMGLPDEYRLPKNYNEAYHLTGDGVAVPVVRHIAQYIIEPLVRSAEEAEAIERHPVQQRRRSRAVRRRPQYLAHRSAWPDETRIRACYVERSSVAC